jgi:hypothetical protein
MQPLFTSEFRRIVYPADSVAMRIAVHPGFSDATFYKWRAKFGGMQAGEAARRAFPAEMFKAAARNPRPAGGA